MSVSVDRISDACDTVATVRLEGYDSPAYQSLDVILYACAEHAETARTEWLDGYTVHASPAGRTTQCGERFTFAPGVTGEA